MWVGLRLPRATGSEFFGRVRWLLLSARAQNFAREEAVGGQHRCCLLLFAVHRHLRQLLQQPGSLVFGL